MTLKLGMVTIDTEDAMPLADWRAARDAGFPEGR
ncbi:citrate lyase beta subunit [Arthrobacter roseus]|nr:citrate lyase beta subunit [Arthrobacter roseus]